MHCYLYFIIIKFFLEGLMGLNFVEYLDLSKAGSLIISDHGFRDFESLSSLNISNTKLSSFKQSWFSRTNFLEYIDASRNQFHTLQRDNLRLLTKLKFANFSYNELNQIERKTFVDLKRLDTLHLNNNDLQTINLGEIVNLKTLNLHDNSISEVC